MSSVDSYVNALLGILSRHPYYWTGPGRCAPQHSGYCDCSGYVCAGLAAVGVGVGCTGSFDLARRAHRAGLGMSISTARRTRGAWVFEGINEGQGGIPGVDHGHVATSLGDGRTVEARGHVAGVGIFNFDSLVWSWASWPVGLTHASTPQPPGAKPTLREGDTGRWVLQLQHELVVGSAQPLRQDGIFGPQTRGAVVNVQRFWHLTVDGICGPATWGVVDLAYAAHGGH